MRILHFNFKNEAIWTVGFSLAIPAAGVLIMLIVWLARP
jgi:hypothetical protein